MYELNELIALNKIDLETRNFIKGYFSKYQLYSAIEIYEHKEIPQKEYYLNSIKLLLKEKQIKLNHKLISQMSIYENRKNKRKRTCTGRIKKMIEEYKKNTSLNLLFITFTFDEKHINNEIAKDKRNIKEWFKKNNYIDYLFNIDYGKKHNRKHYHAIALFENNINANQWKQGNLDFIKIKINSNEKALQEYILKLSQHSFKTTTNERVIYARKKRK